MVQIAVLSNGNQEQQEEKCSRTGLGRQIDIVLSSGKLDDYWNGTSVDEVRGLAALAASGSGPSDGSPREVTAMSDPTIPLPFQPTTMTTALWRRCPIWPATPGAPTPCTPTSCGSGSPAASPPEQPN